MSDIEIKLMKKALETIGSSSLLGRVGISGKLPPATVLILFETFSPEQCRKAGNPDEIIIPEYVPMCLCKDMLALTKVGYSVEIGEWHV